MFPWCLFVNGINGSIMDNRIRSRGDWGIFKRIQTFFDDDLELRGTMRFGTTRTLRFGTMRTIWNERCAICCAGIQICDVLLVRVSNVGVIAMSSLSVAVSVSVTALDSTALGGSEYGSLRKTGRERLGKRLRSNEPWVIF